MTWGRRTKPRDNSAMKSVRRSDFDVTNTVQVSSPEAVLSAIKTLRHRLAPIEADGNAAWRTLGVLACVSR